MVSGGTIGMGDRREKQSYKLLLRDIDFNVSRLNEVLVGKMKIQFPTLNRAPVMLCYIYTSTIFRKRKQKIDGRYDMRISRRKHLPRVVSPRELRGGREESVEGGGG